MNVLKSIKFTVRVAAIAAAAGCVCISPEQASAQSLDKIKSYGTNELTLGRKAPTVLHSLTNPFAGRRDTADILTLMKRPGALAEARRDTIVFLPWFDEEIAGEVCYPEAPDTVITRRRRELPTLGRGYFRAPYYDTWHFMDNVSLESDGRPVFVGSAYDWIDDNRFNIHSYAIAKREFIVNNPVYVTDNIKDLPVPPAEYNAFVDPVTTRIVLKEKKVGDRSGEVNDLYEVELIDWIQSFNASVQFSQSYVSPNWYQGGNRSLLALANIVYNIKLNQKLHPKLLFETTVSYKLGINSAPDDSIRSYNMSEDLFQVNSTFGYKAMKRWYYSANLQFKTQLFHTYPTNSDKLKSAFLSPGELNIGLGMTYEFTNKKKTFSFNASISPLSWQLRTCINSALDETVYDIKPGRKAVNKIGSSAEYTMKWKMAYNITYTSRMFLFTDYKLFQGDWEHTLYFDINRYLSTQIYAHMRYDTDTPRYSDKWSKFQFKEIFSLGFTYKFSNGK